MDKGIIKTIIGEKQREISLVKLVKRPVSYEDAMCYVEIPKENDPGCLLRK